MCSESYILKTERCVFVIFLLMNDAVCPVKLELFQRWSMCNPRHLFVVWLLGMAAKNNASSSRTNPRYTKKSGISWRAVQSPFYSWIIRATCTRSNYNTTLNTRPCQRTKRRSTGGSVAVGSILLLHAPCLCKYISAVTQVAWGMCKCSYVPCHAMPPHILVHIQTIFNHSTLFTMWLLL